MADVLIEKLTAELGADAAQMIAAFVATERAAENAARAVEAASRKAERDLEKAARQAEKETRRAAREAEKEAKRVAREAKKAAKAIRDDFSKSYTELKAQIDIAKDAASKFFGVIQAGLSTLVQWTAGTVAYADALEQASRNTGLTVEQVQALQFAFKDVGIDKATKGLEYFSRQVGLAISQPAGESAKTLADLGVSLFDADGKARSVGSVLLDTADKIRGLKTESEQAAVSSKLLGEESGRGLAKEMAKGSDAIRMQMELARQYGLVLSEETIRAVTELGDRIDTLKKQGAGLIHDFIIPFVPVLTEVARVTEGWIKELRPLSIMVGKELAGSFNGWFRLAQRMVQFFDDHPILAGAIPILGPSIVGFRRDLKAAREAFEREAKALPKVEIQDGTRGPGPTPTEDVVGSDFPDFEEDARKAEDAMIKSAEARIKATQDIFDAEQKHHENLIALVEKEDADRARLDEERLRAAKAITDEQERQAASLIRSYETLAEARAREIQQVHDLAKVNAEVRGMEQELIDRVNAKFDKLEAQAKKTTDTMAKASRAAAQQMRTAFVDFLIDPVNKGFDDLAGNVLNIMKRLASEQLLSGLFNPTPGGGSFLGLFGNPVKKAGGGPVFGPGGPRDDAIPAMLSNGEFVLNAASVKLTNRMFGSDFLYRWNAMGLPSMPRAPRVSTESMPRRFADGGYVSPAAPVAPGATTLDLAIINVSSKEAALEALRSQSGRDIVMNHIGSDGGHRAKRAMGLKG